MEISRCFSMCKNKVSPSMSLSAIREWRFKGNHYKASYQDSTCVMRVSGMNPTRTLLNAAGGLTFLLPDEKQTLSFQYQGKFGKRFEDNRLLAQYLLSF